MKKTNKYDLLKIHFQSLPLSFYIQSKVLCDSFLYMFVSSPLGLHARCLPHCIINDGVIAIYCYIAQAGPEPSTLLLQPPQRRVHTHRHTSLERVFSVTTGKGQGCGLQSTLGDTVVIKGWVGVTLSGHR